MQSSLRPALGILLAVLAAGASAAAFAETTEAVTVKVNMARVLRINAAASTVIVGNPGVADVTIQDPKTLVLTGKSFGQTNLIVLDAAGNPVADTLIQVVQAQPDLMTVYLGQSRTTFSCSPTCQPTVMLGDDAGFSGQALQSSAIVGQSAE